MRDIHELAKNYPKELRAKIAKGMRAATLDILGYLIERTTLLGLVDTGTFRANWHASVNRRSNWHQLWNTFAPAPSPVIKTLRFDDTVFIQNNVPYAVFLEARFGVVAPVMPEIKRIFDGHMKGVFAE